MLFRYSFRLLIRFTIDMYSNTKGLGTTDLLTNEILKNHFIIIILCKILLDRIPIPVGL